MKEQMLATVGKGKAIHIVKVDLDSNDKVKGYSTLCFAEASGNRIGLAPVIPITAEEATCKKCLKIQGPKNQDPISIQIINYFQAAFDFFNEELWTTETGETLGDAVITMQRKRNANGFFHQDIFSVNGKDASEIAINPESMARTPEEVVSTFVHEMAHWWQAQYGKPSRNGYHNKQWAKEMNRIGLPPVSLDNPGKETGQKVTHDIDDNGMFSAKFAQFATKHQYPAVFSKINRKKATRSKTKYTCECGEKGNSIWGKPGLNIFCEDCETRFEEN